MNLEEISSKVEYEMELDYKSLLTQDVIELVSHYISNHLMQYFEENCKSKFYNPISNEFVEPRFDRPEY